MLALLVLGFVFYAFLLCVAFAVFSLCVADFEIAVHEHFKHAKRHDGGNGDRLSPA
ncbi:MAG: hypothetical protein KKF41_13375 [Actinobacteria bacterium]|nr:hypothetical protein [Actinomycetota bacterium]MBU1943910.1 hypothetical protein [Actinomycetota bacterium]MBU2688568.1 hypothetical protein [Actinomycetota bacterium]